MAKRKFEDVADADNEPYMLYDGGSKVLSLLLNRINKDHKCVKRDVENNFTCENETPAYSNGYHFAFCTEHHPSQRADCSIMRFSKSARTLSIFSTSCGYIALTAPIETIVERIDALGADFFKYHDVKPFFAEIQQLTREDAQRIITTFNTHRTSGTPEHPPIPPRAPQVVHKIGNILEELGIRSKKEFQRFITQYHPDVIGHHPERAKELATIILKAIIPPATKTFN